MGRVNIGGQAVMEGVMMKNNDKYAVAVRKPDKEIEVQVNSCKSSSDRPKICSAPIVRGVVNFVDSLMIGVKTLMYSAEFFEDEEPDTTSKKAEKKNRKENSKKSEHKKSGKEKDKSDDAMMAGTVVLSIVIAVGLFMLLPAWIASLLEKVIPNHILLGLIEGVIRLVIFLAYVVIISCMEDIKRTYMYHGAEHKTINCLEHGKDLTVENVMQASRFHKRCGTSFLFIVMIVSILVFMCITVDAVWLRLLLRVLLVPVIAGISYEFIRYAGRSESVIANALSKPGLLIQRLTTKEPTEDMVEVAIASVEAVLDWRAYLEEQKKE
ncbi:MAG: DUF1385 domain-containing protein [Wujia sp.]